MCALKKGYVREDILVPTFSGATDKEFIRNEVTRNESLNECSFSFLPFWQMAPRESG